MKVLQIIEPGQCALLDMPMPELRPHHVLVKILAVTTCPHWDMHIFGGEPMLPGRPLNYPYTPGQPGHEACGEVVDIGAGVTAVSKGQRVCAWRDRGHSHPGCYAQYVLFHEEDLIGVPSDMPPETCAPLELAMCVSAHIMYAIKLDEIDNQRVGVFGLGSAGLVAIQLLRDAGAREVVGFDTVATRRAQALDMGATLVLDPLSSDMSHFPDRNSVDALNCTVDCVGTTAAVHQAMALTKRLVILFAVQREPYVFSPESWFGLTLAGTQPHTWAAAQYAAQRLTSGALDLAPLVTHKLPLSQYAHAVELLSTKQAMKVAFIPDLD